MRLGFGTILLMLLTVVAAGVSLLVYYASQVPAITSEFNAWMGRPNPVSDSAEARLAHLKFLLVVYSAPLLLGTLVYLVHFMISALERWLRARDPNEDEPFRME